MGPRRHLTVAAAVLVFAVMAPAAWAEHSVARIWNEHLLNAIRKDVPKPPPHARNLYHTSIAMWDAWAAYDPVAQGILTHEKHTAADVEAAREEAISFAAYRVLKYRFPVTPACPHPGSAQMQAEFDAQMDAFGYDKTFTSTAGNSPAAVGNRIGLAVLAYGFFDGANEGPGMCYADDTGYSPQNPDLIFKLPGTQMYVPNCWQPLAFDYLVLQNGIVIGAAVQSFVGTGWGDVRPFALTPQDLPQDPDPPFDCFSSYLGVPKPYLDPGCPPQLGGVGDATLKQAMLELIRFSGRTDPSDGVTLDISPGAVGNNSLGTDDGTGHPVNPYTGQPYAPNVVKRADWERVVAQFWSDGPQSETPPGHWNVLANEMADNPATIKRIGGKGPEVNDLEWDVKTYIALNGALHDAAIGAWGTKNYYDSARPISLIRYMAGLGQSSDPSGLSYHPDGLPLEPGLVEVITPETTAPGQRHEHLAAFCELGLNWGKPCHVNADCADFLGTGICVSALGELAFHAWNGPPVDPVTQTSGVGWIRAKSWMPWFPKTFVTPPFPGYTSGHSTFSRAGAEVLTAVRNDPFVPGGLGSFTAEAGEELFVEDGPSETLELQWATWYDASDQAGISRRFGGIHPFIDDYPGRVMGSQIGKKAWAKAVVLFGPDKVDVCHAAGNDEKKHTITVDKQAVQAHLNHGDTVGACQNARGGVTAPKLQTEPASGGRLKGVRQKQDAISRGKPD